MSDAITPVVLFREIESVSDKKIGIATLNTERSLNALSLPMIQALYDKLQVWQADNNIAMVWLEGAGEKAFCAGGDVVSLYKAMQQTQSERDAAITQFFFEEYRLDYLIHTFGKPVLVWGHGIVMGGGLGLLAGASHRVMTERSRIAMPEVTIGLYPDVGGSYFLNHMPAGVGVFLGLTGASINALDAKYIGLADFALESRLRSQLFDKLLVTNWGDTIALNHDKLNDVLRSLELESINAMPAGQVKPHADTLARLPQFGKASDIAQEIMSWPAEPDSWLAKAQKSLKHGSPITINLVVEQLKRAKGKKLSDCFRMELGLSLRCAQYGEFAEGVRALLIDKDNQPKWRFHSIRSVSDDVIDWLFNSPWSAEQHPLAELGANHQ